MVTELLEPVVGIVISEQRTPPKEFMTWEEFMEWTDEDTHAEWVGGRIVMSSPASMRHQDIGSLLETMLRPYTETHQSGKIMRAPFMMRLEHRERGREPDLMFVDQTRLNLLQKNYLDGPADLIVEIISPESIIRDRSEKFLEYETAGVREYWLLDPERQIAEFYQLEQDGLYRLAWLEDADIYRSQVIAGFWLRLSWLWQTPPPPALQLLRELKLI